MGRPCANLFLSGKNSFFFAEKITLAPDKGIADMVIFSAPPESPEKVGTHISNRVDYFEALETALWVDLARTYFCSTKTYSFLLKILS